MMRSLVDILAVVSWFTDTGSKGYPLFRFGTGREGGWVTSSARRTSSRPPIYVLASNTGHNEFTQVQAALRVTTLLLHVWIEWFIMLKLIEVVAGENPGGVG